MLGLTWGEEEKIYDDEHKRKVRKLIKTALIDKFGENEGELQYLKLIARGFTFHEFDKIRNMPDSWTESQESTTLDNECSANKLGYLEKSGHIQG